MRASTESSSDSDSVTRWWTHSSAMESYAPTTRVMKRGLPRFGMLPPPMSTSPYSPYLPKNRRQKAWYAVAPALTQSTQTTGGVRAYERQHRTTLANILNRGDRLPADVIPKIVDFWAHVGWYAIEHDRPLE